MDREDILAKVKKCLDLAKFQLPEQDRVCT